MTDRVDEFLQHYGKKGMKWGTRRAAPTLGSSKDAKRAKKILDKSKKHTINSLSNKELNDLNNRLGLEQRYSQLNPSRAAKGRKLVKSLLATGAAINTAVAFSKSPAGQAIGKILVKPKS